MEPNPKCKCTKPYSENGAIHHVGCPARCTCVEIVNSNHLHDCPALCDPILEKAGEPIKPGRRRLQLQEAQTELELWKLFYNSSLIAILGTGLYVDRSSDAVSDAARASDASIQAIKLKWAELSSQE